MGDSWNEWIVDELEGQERKASDLGVSMSYDGRIMIGRDCRGSDGRTAHTCVA